MRFECRVTKATETHSDYAIVIFSPRKKRLRERSSVLQYSTLPVLLNYLIRLFFCTPDDGRVYRPKHVEWTCREINSLHIVASVGHSIEYLIRLLINVYIVFVSNRKNVSLTLTMCALKSISVRSAKQRAPLG